MHMFEQIIPLIYLCAYLRMSTSSHTAMWLFELLVTVRRHADSSRGVLLEDPLFMMLVLLYVSRGRVSIPCKAKTLQCYVTRLDSRIRTKKVHT